MFDEELDLGAGRRGHARRRPTADRGGRGHGQDDDARRRVAAPARARRASRADPAAHLQPASGARAVVRAPRARRMPAQPVASGAARSTRSATGCSGSTDVRSASARLHRPGPGRRRRRDEPGSRRTGLRPTRAAVPAQGDPRRHLLAHGERRRRSSSTSSSATIRGAWTTLDGIREIFRAYTDRKRERNVLDYDDLLLYWKALACGRADARASSPRMFDHVLVDEYQDTNALQADILEGLRPPEAARNLTVVGDDAQAIYGFRAATVRNILEFPERFPGRDDREVRAELPLDATAPCGIERRRSRSPAASREDAVVRARPATDRPIAPRLPGRGRAVRRRSVAAVLDQREAGVPLKAAGCPVPRRAPLATSWRSSWPGGTSRS